MTKQEYEVVEKLKEHGYNAVVRLAENGFLLKVKRVAKDLNGKGQTEIPSVAIEPKAISIVQKFGYNVKEINVEEYEKGVNARIVPFLYCVKEYPDEY